MNTIEFKGISSTTIDGLIVCEFPPISKPPMRVAQTEIDGRHGTIIEELGYSAYNKSIEIGLKGNFDINKVIKYFSGEGDIVFGNEPDKVYHGIVANQIDYNRLLRFRKATVTFLVQPFKHKKNEAMKETEIATATGTNIVLKDGGSTPFRISTDAENVVVHGKNIINANAFGLHKNTSFAVLDEGYTIIAKGGTQATYTSSRLNLPIEMKGKKYTLKYDSITAEQKGGNVQVTVVTSSGTEYFSVFSPSTKTSFTMPEDATSISVGVYTNNTNTILAIDNVVTVKGLCLVPTEFEKDAWSKYQGMQTISVVDGVADATGFEGATIISNADNVEMSVEYFKSFEVFNEGLEESRPLMILRGNGTVEIKVNGIAQFTYTFPEGENEVYIDSEIEEAYLGAALKNRNMLGEFPVLVPKTNKIEWTGDVESIEILPRSRWL